MSLRRDFLKTEKIVTKFEGRKENLIKILLEVQKEYRHIPEDILNYVSVALDIPPARVFGVATFYSQFSLKPKGLYQILLCDGTACHLVGSNTLVQAIENELKIKPGEVTEDFEFGLDLIGCIGACALAPAMVINGEVYGNLQTGDIKKIIQELRDKPNA